MKGGVRRVLNMVEALGPLEHLAVMHTRSQKLAQEVADRLAERTDLRECIWVQETGAVLACLAGPGVIAVMAVPVG